MKNLKFLSFLIAVPLFVLSAFNANAYIDKEYAVVNVLNKAAGKVQTIQVPVGYAVEYEKLDITVQTCKQTDPFDAKNFFMFIEISKLGDGEIFSGWMNRNEPGENPLQNEDYDLWLVECE